MNIESMAIMVSAVVAVLGYLYNSWCERQSEKFKLKSRAYANFLGQIEKLLPESTGENLTDNHGIRELNKRLVSLTTYAPDSVVICINKLAKNKNLDRQGINELRLILHEDLHSPIWPIKHCVKKLSKKDFPHFPFRT